MKCQLSVLAALLIVAPVAASAQVGCCMDPQDQTAARLANDGPSSNAQKLREIKQMLDDIAKQQEEIGRIIEEMKKEELEKQKHRKKQA